MAYTENGVKKGVKRKVFISHYKGDRKYVDEFIQKFATEEDVFIPKVLGANDNDAFINSTDTDYVMTQIRNKYLSDSTVTIVLIGDCTHSRRYIDWEIKSSLSQRSYTPNGLIGILLPYRGDRGYLPERMFDNLDIEDSNNSYALYKSYPDSAKELDSWIEEAFLSRTIKSSLIKNSNEMMKYNGKCKVCEITH